MTRQNIDPEDSVLSLCTVCETSTQVGLRIGRVPAVPNRTAGEDVNSFLKKRSNFPNF
ncbi:MAG: hypothetical protein O4751_07020 [Trichodesmium sp. St2_bin6]|nr:hypothetical protein [Trichodesmium sp. MAG_R01]MDE5072678.1 hypothetical protein [Trichodesmium sp. St5_bin8]MDE5078028.1 hypothetical protein [Trichodesmium sp. St2_bin6]MDE5092064.1 hypothetical protein [Trichodesmium sp. St18_bin3_1_1]MDE5104008.1 hypothetical protein [Trichodesmium sp. St19_bin2]